VQGALVVASTVSTCVVVGVGTVLFSWINHLFGITEE
jgi:hypothetical protein